MKKLKRGEFGLIIPEKLKNSRKELESIYSEYMSGFSSRSLNPHSHHLFKVSVSTEFVKDKKKRFCTIQIVTYLCNSLMILLLL